MLDSSTSHHAGLPDFCAAMKYVGYRARVEELAIRGGKLINRDWKSSAEFFVEAHRVALENDDSPLAAIMSCSLARCVYGGGRLSLAMRFAARGFSEDSSNDSTANTLAYFLCKAAKKSLSHSTKQRRAERLLAGASHLYNVAASVAKTDGEREQYLRLARP